MKDCKLILEHDNANADARRLIPKLKELQKVEDNKSKNMFANMCKGLGKLKTPEPQVTKPVVPDDSDEDDEDVPLEASKYAPAVVPPEESKDAPAATAE